VSPPPITASRKLPAPPETVFGYLDDLANHVSLAPHSARVLSIGPGDRRLGHAVVRLRGPLGLRRTATTEIIRADAPGFIAGRASVGSRTRACVTWRIAPDEGGSDVTLSASIEAARFLDALVLRLGGRRWIARRFAAALGVLEQKLQEAPVPHAAPGATGQLSRAGATP
jgi:hypothetical protein